MELAVAGPSSSSDMPASILDEDVRHSVPKINDGTASNIPRVAAPNPISAPEATMKDASDLPSPRLRSSRTSRGDSKEAMSMNRTEGEVEGEETEEEVKRPLCLLDLPLDVLKDILRQVTHTNDLIALTLCHSALHNLAIPHLYSRFDIVWPDNSAHGELRSGVDALTYGLATLVMAEEIFGEAPNQRQHHEEQQSCNRLMPAGRGKASDRAIRRRRGNHYAQFTRKFSLGNGPGEWVQEYLISKEGGKMLGTLVALAVARMRSLESFTWDMPTGVLRDVWLALSSLGDRNDGAPCHLERLWVRWHDNSSPDIASSSPPQPPPINITTPLSAPNLSGGGYIASSGMSPQIHPGALDRIEHPTFSVLPPLKSLSVLDIDELAYLDEMAVLIGNSRHQLCELRVGVAQHATTRDWATVWRGDHVQQVDRECPTAGSLTIGEKRLGGVLGILTGFVCDMREPKIELSDRTKRRTLSQPFSARDTPERVLGITNIPQPNGLADVELNSSAVVPDVVAGNVATLRLVVPGDLSNDSLPEADSEIQLSPVSGDSVTPLVPNLAFDSDLVETTRQVIPGPSVVVKLEPSQTDHRNASNSDELPDCEAPHLDGTLELENLELERVPLSVPVLQRGLDWTRLTSLTLLHCQNHEQLWKALRRTFAPRSRSPIYPHARRTPNATPRKAGRSSSTAHESELDYPIKLRKIHTNNVSPSLITFLKETLAPNSLEVLFLQEARSYSSPVSIDSIFRGPIKRHRGSLKKLLVDSSEKKLDGQVANSSRWKKWLLKRDVLGFICGGKMPELRELGMAIDYRDWVSFVLTSCFFATTLPLTFIYSTSSSNVSPPSRI